MASSKVTFTLDVETIRRLRDAAERLAKPQSAVVREAIEDFHDRLGKLSERERTQLLSAFDQLRYPGTPSLAGYCHLRNPMYFGSQSQEQRGRKRLGSADWAWCQPLHST